MKVVVKTVGGSKFEIVAVDTDTVYHLKELLSSLHGLPAEGQKLIYVGKILKDTQTLESVGFVETGFLACVVIKGKKQSPTALPLVFDVEGEAPPPDPAVSPSESSHEAEQQGIVAEDTKEDLEQTHVEEEKPSAQTSPAASSGSGFRAARASRSGGSLANESLSDEAVEAARAVEVKEKEAKVRAEGAAAAQKKAEVQRQLFQSTAQSLREAEEAMLAAQNEYHVQKQALHELKVDAQCKERAARKAAEDVARAKKNVEVVLQGGTGAEAYAELGAKGSGSRGSGSGSGSGSAAGCTFTLPTDSPLLRLIDHPTIDFEQMRRRVQANSSNLGVVLQEIGAVDPELLGTIHKHQIDFVALMNQGIERVRALQEEARAQQQQHITFSMDDALDLAGQAGMMGFGDMYGEGDDDDFDDDNDDDDDDDDDDDLDAGSDEADGEAPTRMTVELSEAEMDAIQRIVRMGYNRNQVIEAFVMCGRNELVAASYLMEGMEVMEQGGSGYDEYGSGYEYPFDDGYGYEPDDPPELAATPAVSNAPVSLCAAAEPAALTAVPDTTVVADPSSPQKKPTASPDAPASPTSSPETELPSA
jgi:UV excision repair protein RAD23